MFYLFDKDGNTSTFCPDSMRLFDMFAVENDDGEKALPDGYSIKEYDGYVEPGMLYLDDAGEVKEHVFVVDEAEEAAREKARALAELDTQYQADKSELSTQYLDAAMAGDTDTMTAIKDELAALNAKYDADYAALDK
ncbi:hypothetical protein [Mitsuokella multacida]|uniref:hypothetical protein n=1 Tax=Mitsuokella multacida TaxID=52226 RepID=UPI003D058735